VPDAGQGAGATGPAAAPAASPAAGAEQLAPFFQSTPSPLPGVFIRQDGKLAYVDGDRRVELTMGAHPSALAAGERVLLSDDRQTYWFDWKVGTLQAIPGLPPVAQAAGRGTTYVLRTYREALVWTPGQDPVKLAQPDHVFGLTGVSLSPDGRYAVAAFDLDIPEGPRAGAVWAYDLQTGQIAPWPIETPRFGYGAWLLGWSGPHTLRFVFGYHGNCVGYTWALPDKEPVLDGTGYRMMSDAWPTSDGAWFLYSPIPEQAVVQSIQPDSRPLDLPFPLCGAYDPRILLNGHPAGYQSGNPRVWFEVLPDGTLRRWEGAEALF
jgi:hypothetical protein